MDRGIERARGIAELFGLPQDPVEYVVGRGSVNHVVVLGAGADRWVIRFAVESDRPDEFATEHWCAEPRSAEVVGVFDGL